ncbi:YojF family protein [Salipaludibacillus agaradhaerens]|jgi:hypothetical protein|uniref:YojF family protein n=1 Tax=Salipaludibacillus agaradhaerens TaxID=76935 RepID=A0A9Q4B553_SALAG|nr:YojF family protein [Salipaludibacillus agaradhaerens]UJW59340.1 YojF family protein [Bacillus sp. A116_S68]MCR6098633.1 YojF family protein [Salipaludibacillus agaradhaerens]MCR6108301.1 YojF family protein [Salipaludibacillus agaradhaerens]MCR6115640.1 YojF family protein [Salipaludibacillus agaradhaerens]MCR6120326.1 YojF family protein [Salipaludibacillus agaradhaerens]
MKPIDPKLVQEHLIKVAGQALYIHLETTNGAYATHKNEAFFSAGAFIRNVQLTFLQGKITGKGPYRIGLETEQGWLYAEGLTEWELDSKGRLLLAGHDAEGKLAVALQMSASPFPK